MNNHDRIKIIIIYVIGLILILRTLLFQLSLYHIYQYYLLVRLAYLVPSPCQQPMDVQSVTTVASLQLQFWPPSRLFST